MVADVDFYYEFSSPYGYIAAQLIEDLATEHGRAVNWKPFLLGPVFKAEGTQSLVSYPMKGPYSKHDIERSAGYYKIPYKWPKQFPILTVNAARAVYWAKDLGGGKDKALSLAIYHAAFGEGRNISDLSVLSDAAISVGIDAADMQDAIKQESVKQRLKDEVQAAIGRKVFGSPFFFVDDEPFWGVDRLPHIRQWLETGGW